MLKQSLTTKLVPQSTLTRRQRRRCRNLVKWDLLFRFLALPGDGVGVLAGGREGTKEREIVLLPISGG